MNNGPDPPKNRIIHLITPEEPVDTIVEDTPSNTPFGQSAKGELTALPTQAAHLHIVTGMGQMMMQPIVIFKPRKSNGKREGIVKFLVNGQAALGIPMQLRTAKLMAKWFEEIAKGLETVKPEEDA